MWPSAQTISSGLLNVALARMHSAMSFHWTVDMQKIQIIYCRVVPPLAALKDSANQIVWSTVQHICLSNASMSDLLLRCFTAQEDRVPWKLLNTQHLGEEAQNV